MRVGVRGLSTNQLFLFSYFPFLLLVCVSWFRRFLNASHLRSSVAAAATGCSLEKVIQS